MKKRFDDIFDSARYTKALDVLNKQKKGLASKAKDISGDLKGLHADKVAAQDHLKRKASAEKAIESADAAIKASDDKQAALRDEKARISDKMRKLQAQEQGLQECRAEVDGLERLLRALAELGAGGEVGGDEGGGSEGAAGGGAAHTHLLPQAYIIALGEEGGGVVLLKLSWIEDNGQTIFHGQARPAVAAGAPPPAAPPSGMPPSRIPPRRPSGIPARPRIRRSETAPAPDGSCRPPPPPGARRR